MEKVEVDRVSESEEIVLLNFPTKLRLLALVQTMSDKEGRVKKSEFVEEASKVLETENPKRVINYHLNELSKIGLVEVSDDYIVLKKPMFSLKVTKFVPANITLASLIFSFIIFVICLFSGEPYALIVSLINLAIVTIIYLSYYYCIVVNPKELIRLGIFSEQER